MQPHRCSLIDLSSSPDKVVLFLQTKGLSKNGKPEKQNITILMKIEKLSKKPPNPDDVKKEPLTDSFWKPDNLNLNVDSAHDRNSMTIEMICTT